MGSRNGSYVVLAALVLGLAGVPPSWANPVPGGQDSGPNTEAGTAQDAGEAPRVRRLGDLFKTEAEDDWMPSLQPTEGSPAAEPPSALASALARGEAALAAGRLVAPDGDNARSWFQQALDAEPANAQAEQGLRRVADALLAAARAAANAGNRTAALARIGQIRAFRPGHPGVDALAAEIEREGEVERLLAEADERLAAGLLVDAGTAEDEGGGSALAAIEAVLTVDPGNVAAAERVVRLAERVATEAVAQAEAGDGARAEALIGALASPSLGPLPPPAEAAVARAEASIRAVQLGEVEAALAAGRIDDAEAALAALATGPATPEAAALGRAIQRVRRLRSLEPGSTFRDALRGGGDGPVLVVIPYGGFLMGSPESEDGRASNEGPQTAIRFTVPFALARTETTVAEFRRFVLATGYETDAERQGRSTIYDVDSGQLEDERRVTWERNYRGEPAEPDDPVIHVSWADAAAYAAWLTEATGQPYRLPSEAEFEYALRAGSSSRFWWGDDAPRDTVENLTGARDRIARWEWPHPFRRYGDEHWGPAPAGSFPPNPFGLHDAGGNVMEWVADCYESSLADLPADGRARDGAERCDRVLKGGSWATPPSRTRSAQRTHAPVDRATCLVGFRVSRDL